MLICLQGVSDWQELQICKQNSWSQHNKYTFLLSLRFSFIHKDQTWKTNPIRRRETLANYSHSTSKSSAHSHLCFVILLFRLDVRHMGEKAMINFVYLLLPLRLVIFIRFEWFFISLYACVLFCVDSIASSGLFFSASYLPVFKEMALIKKNEGGR